jgi:IBR domain, a half RING-finger domain
MYLKSQIMSGRCAQMKCPDPDCKRIVTSAEVQRSVERDVYDKYQEFMLQDHLKKDPDCRWCPKAGCEVAMIGNAANPMMRCPNPTCQFTMCFNCRVEWHADCTCEQYQKWKADNEKAGDLYEEWRKKSTKKCPRCNADIQKNGGMKIRRISVLLCNSTTRCH